MVAGGCHHRMVKRSLQPNSSLFLQRRNRLCFKAEVCREAATHHRICKGGVQCASAVPATQQSFCAQVLLPLGSKPSRPSHPSKRKKFCGQIYAKLATHWLCHLFLGSENKHIYIDAKKQQHKNTSLLIIIFKYYLQISRFAEKKMHMGKWCGGEENLALLVPSGQCARENRGPAQTPHFKALIKGTPRAGSSWSSSRKCMAHWLRSWVLPRLWKSLAWR